MLLKQKVRVWIYEKWKTEQKKKRLIGEWNLYFYRSVQACFDDNFAFSCHVAAGAVWKDCHDLQPPSFLINCNFPWW